MTFLLDTNACIALINGKASIRDRFERANAGENQICVSSIVAFELWYGVAKSARMEANAARVEAFFAGPVRLVPFENEDARAAGSIRAAVEAIGRTIGAYDLLIAGQAFRRKMVLVTANVREFSRIKGLAWEDWGRN